MEFRTFIELIDGINRGLGQFCSEFQYKRKDLLGSGKTPGNDQLFGNIKEDWAINRGGGVELQYHINFNKSIPAINYGLALSTQYVPFKTNHATPVFFVKPFMDAFLIHEKEIRAQLPEYDFIEGSIDLVRKPEHDKFCLFGKHLRFEKREDYFFIEDRLFQMVLDDLKKQYLPFVEVFMERNRLIHMNNEVKKYTDIFNVKPQIILQGPPGTGKTYTAKDMAFSMIFDRPISQAKKYRDSDLILLEESDQFKLIQFHPSYTYEDFVRGIVAKPNENGGGVLYKTENRTLGKFAAKALVNYRNQDKDNETISKEVLLDQYFKEFVDSISDKLEESEGFLKLTETFGLVSCDEDAFRYRSENESWKNGNRMLFKDIIQAYNDGNKERKDLMKNNNLSGLAKQHASYFVRVLNLFQSYLKDNNLKFGEVVVTVEPLKPFVLIIDEINRANLPAVLGELIYALEYRGEALEGMYELESESGREVGKIIIPPNLYIIGTMNTADRSVGHIDYAIRRRFAFVDILPNKSVLTLPLAFEFFEAIENLFEKYTASDFEKQHVLLGHSYFLADDNKTLKLKLKYEVLPILNEYLNDGVINKTEASVQLLKEISDKIDGINE